MHPSSGRGGSGRSGARSPTGCSCSSSPCRSIPVGGHPALQFDIATRRSHVFGGTFYPTDNLILVAFGFGIIVTVFFVGSTFGRMWCGYACPQTVWLEFLFRPIEAFLEGGPSNQRKLNLAPWTGRKFAIKAAKWAIWTAVALLMSSTFVAYFTGWGPLAARPRDRTRGVDGRPVRDRVRGGRHRVRLRLVPRPDVHDRVPVRPPAERAGRPGHDPGGVRREARRPEGAAEGPPRRRPRRRLHRVPRLRERLPDRAPTSGAASSPSASARRSASTRATR